MSADGRGRKPGAAGLGPDMHTIAVTGITGRVGFLVARSLSSAGIATRLVGRKPARFPDLPGAVAAPPASYRDTAAMTVALRGADTMFMVSATESDDRLVDHRSAIDAAVAAGVTRIIYTSFLSAAADCTFTFARDHFHTEQLLAGSGLRWVALRDAFYQDELPFFADGDGTIRGPAGDGVIAAVARDDVAAAAAAALQGDSVAGIVDLTGPEAFTFDELAATLTELSGRPVRYERETVEQAYASRERLRAPMFAVDGWVSTYTAVAAGEMASVSDGVSRLTGRPATSLGEPRAAP